jgi:uncharacterized membrane protein YgcG
MRLLRILILLLATDEAPAFEEDVADFLVPGRASSCLPERICDEVTFSDRSCLNASIPWELPYLQVRCAFRCCLWYWQRKLGLASVVRKRTEQMHRLKYYVDDPYEVIFHRYSAAQISTVRFGDLSPDPCFPFGGLVYDYPIQQLQAKLHQKGGMPLKPRAYIDIGDKPFGGKGSSPCIRGEIDCFFSSPHNTSSTLHALPMGWYCPAKKYMNSTFKLHREVDRSDASRPVLLGCGCCNALGRHLVETRGWSAPEEELRTKLSHRTYVLKVLRRNGFPCDCSDVWNKHKGNRWQPRLRYPASNARDYWCPPRDYSDLMTSRKFTVSPYGNGWSNFREWEVLGFGGIPLVDFHPGTAKLFEGLPVVQVKNWSHVTPAFLEKEWIRFTSAKIDMKKAFWPFWFLTLTRYMKPVDDDEGKRCSGASSSSGRSSRSRSRSRSSSSSGMMMMSSSGGGNSSRGHAIMHASFIDALLEEKERVR